MEKSLDCLIKEDIWNSAVEFVCQDLKDNSNGDDVQNISVYGLGTSRLTKFAVDLSFA